MVLTTMRFGRRFREYCVAVCLIATCAAPVAARSAVIGSEQYLNVIDRRASLERIDAVLARANVAAELRRLGVAPELALARAEALNDQELLLLADELENLPAGGSLLGIVGIVFIVLLVLELVGVIDIFNKI